MARRALPSLYCSEVLSLQDGVCGHGDYIAPKRKRREHTAMSIPMTRLGPPRSSSATLSSTATSPPMPYF